MKVRGIIGGFMPPLVRRYYLTLPRKKKKKFKKRWGFQARVVSIVKTSNGCHTVTLKPVNYL